MDLQKMHEMDQMDTKADFYEKQVKVGSIDGYVEFMEGGNPAKYIPIEKNAGETLEAAAARIVKSRGYDPADFSCTTIGYRIVYAEKPD